MNRYSTDDTVYVNVVDINSIKSAVPAPTPQAKAPGSSVAAVILK